MKAGRGTLMMAMLAFIITSASIASAQGPLRKQVEFTINSAFELNNSDVVLPAGKYILFQIHQNDTNLFAMYRDNLMDSPIAMVRTTRIVYNSGQYPDDFQMLVGMDEETIGALPVITGWAIPGDDGWEITTTVPDRDRIGVRTISRSNHKYVRVQISAKARGF